MKPFFAALVGVAAAGLLWPAAAMADPPKQGPPGNDSLGAGWRQQQDEARQGVRQRQLLPLASVIEEIRRKTPGRQLDAGLEYEGARAVYRVRWMTTDGRRVDYMIDAATGAILGRH